MRAARWGLLTGALLALAAAQARPETTYDNRAAAQTAAGRLRAAGHGVRIVQGAVKTPVHEVRLTFYQTRAAALLAADKLRQYGVESRVIEPRERFGYTVQAGYFTSAAAAEQRVAALRELGFVNLRVAATEIPVATWQVVDLGPRPNTRPTPASTLPAKPVATPTSPETATEPTEFRFGDAADASQDSAQASGEADILTFGATSNAGVPTVAAPKTFEAHVDELRLEAGYVSDADSPVTSSHNLSLTSSLKWRPSARIDAQFGFRLDAYAQGGTPDFTAGDADYDEIFVRVRGDDSRFTAGSQIVRWGRMDELSSTNLLLRADMTRYTLDGLADRYRAQPALRYEYFSGVHKLDVLALPVFDGAALPERDSLWSPIDRQRGQIQGFAPNPLLASLVQSGSFDEDFDDGSESGGGLRYTYSGQGLDLGFSALYGHPTTPYYQLDPRVRAALLTGAPPDQAIAATRDPTFAARYPATALAGADLAFTLGESTWRAELTYTDKTPVTTADLRFDTVPVWNWAAGIELFPGDGDNRLTVQLNGRHLMNSAPIADHEDLYSVSGELENLFAQNTWRLRTRLLASSADGEQDLYFNPELAWLRFEPHEFYFGWHVFSGDESLFSGYHRDQDLIVLGWRTQL